MKTGGEEVLNMKVFMKMSEDMVSVNLSHFNIVFGGNGHGKSHFLDFVYQGLQGKLKKAFLVNGEVVEKNQFQVIKIDEYASFLEEMKLGSKSYLKQKLEERLEEIPSKIDDLKRSLELEIKNELLYQFEFLKGVNIEFGLDLNEIILKNVVFEEKKYSFSKLRKLFIETKIHQVENETGVLLVDHFDLGFTLYERNQMIHYLSEMALSKNIMIVVTTSNFDHFNENSLFVYKNKFYQNMMQLFSRETLLDIKQEEKYLYFEEELELLFQNKLKEKVEYIKTLLEKTSNSF